MPSISPTRLSLYDVFYQETKPLTSLLADNIELSWPQARLGLTLSVQAIVSGLLAYNQRHADSDKITIIKRLLSRGNAQKLMDAKSMNLSTMETAVNLGHSSANVLFGKTIVKKAYKHIAESANVNDEQAKKLLNSVTNICLRELAILVEQSNIDDERMHHWLQLQSQFLKASRFDNQPEDVSRGLPVFDKNWFDITSYEPTDTITIVELESEEEPIIHNLLFEDVQNIYLPQEPWLLTLAYNNDQHLSTNPLRIADTNQEAPSKTSIKKPVKQDTKRKSSASNIFFNKSQQNEIKESQPKTSDVEVIDTKENKQDATDTDSKQDEKQDSLDDIFKEAEEGNIDVAQTAVIAEDTPKALDLSIDDKADEKENKDDISSKENKDSAKLKDDKDRPTRRKRSEMSTAKSVSADIKHNTAPVVGINKDGSVTNAKQGLSNLKGMKSKLKNKTVSNPFIEKAPIWRNPVMLSVAGITTAVLATVIVTNSGSTDEAADNKPLDSKSSQVETTETDQTNKELVAGAVDKNKADSSDTGVVVEDSNSEKTEETKTQDKDGDIAIVRVGDDKSSVTDEEIAQQDVKKKETKSLALAKATNTKNITTSIKPKKAASTKAQAAKKSTSKKTTAKKKTTTKKKNANITTRSQMVVKPRAGAAKAKPKATKKSTSVKKTTSTAVKAKKPLSTKKTVKPIKPTVKSTKSTTSTKKNVTAKKPVTKPAVKPTVKPTVKKQSTSKVSKAKTQATVVKSKPKTQTTKKTTSKASAYKKAKNAVAMKKPSKPVTKVAKSTAKPVKKPTVKKQTEVSTPKMTGSTTTIQTTRKVIELTAKKPSQAKSGSTASTKASESRFTQKTKAEVLKDIQQVQKSSVNRGEAQKKILKMIQTKQMTTNTLRNLVNRSKVRMDQNIIDIFKELQRAEKTGTQINLTSKQKAILTEIWLRAN